MRDRTITETILWHARVDGPDDSHGNPTATWADPAELGIWRFAPGGSSEPRIPGQDRVITEPTIYLPSNNIGPDDEVTVRSRRYAVEGGPADWVNGSFTGFVIGLRRVDG